MNLSLVQYQEFYPYQVGGPAVTAYNLLKEFDKSNIKVNFFIFWNGPRLTNADLHLSPNVRIHTAWYLPWPSLRPLIDLLRSPDSIVHFNSLGVRPPHPFLPLLCRLCHKTVVCTVHGYTPLELRLSKRHRWPLSWAVKVASGMSLRTADRLVVFSEYMRALLARHVPLARIEVLPIGVNVREFENAKGERKGNELRVIFLGRLVPEKGVEVLIRATRMAEDMGTRIKTTLVGEDTRGGSFRSRLEMLIKDIRLENEVEFTGALTGNRKAAHLKNSDVLVLPSYVEAIPIVILEAFAAGLPVVASRVGGIPELVRPGYNGLLVTPGDPTELAAAISTLAKDRKLRRRLGENAKRSARKYDWSHVANEYLGLYERLDHRRTPAV